jgi:alpha-glucosidase
MGSLRGSICIYQGEELGLAEADVAFEDLQDPYGIRFWPKFKGRDGCRTPMPWAATEAHAGFTQGKPWLPVDPRHAAMAVNVQEHDAGSMLNRYRVFLQFRRSLPALVKGEIAFLHADDALLAFTRTHGNDKVLCVFNFSNRTETLHLPAIALIEDLGGSGFGGTQLNGVVSLSAHDAFFARVA